MWRLGVEAILGLRREAGVLRVDPCIPRRWSGFEAWLRVGHETLHVVVDNPERVSSGVTDMTVDGAPVDSNGVQLSPGETRAREVRVRLGARRAEHASLPVAVKDVERAPERRDTSSHAHRAG